MTRTITTVRLQDSVPAAGEARRVIDLVRAEGAAVICFPPSHNGTHVITMWMEDAGTVLVAGSETKQEWPVVVVCATFDPAQASALVTAGVCGVALLADAARTVIPTIAAVSSGQICLPRHAQVAAVRPVLSIREKQVLGLVALGLANGEIAEQLVVTESTVKSHLTSAFAKLGVRSRHEAADLLLDPQSGLGLGFLSLVPDVENGAH
jgi:DNA-binding NarL/FixJ family response regulator